MQSDTFLPNTDSEDEEYSSDSSGELPKNNNVGVLYEFPKEAVEGERFIDQSSQAKYLSIRNELFTQATETARICFHTNYTDADGVGYKNEIDLVDKYKLGGVKNIIGFELISADIRNTGGNHPFVDLVIPEIPHKACKINEKGMPIIDRVSVRINDNTNFYVNEPQRSYNNYFSPILLNEFHIKQYDNATSPNIIQYECIYEFELTILKRSLSER